MEERTSKSIAVFSRPFTISGFDETLPAGEYEIETELTSPPDQEDPAGWKASVLVKLHPRRSHPGLARSLTVSLAELDHARARDKLTGKALSDFFLEEMLTDPMIRLMMKADGVSEMQLRHFYSGLGSPDSDSDAATAQTTSQNMQYEVAIGVAENEGMPSRDEPRLPGRRREKARRG